MPTYEYSCSNCGAELEVVQKMSDNTLVDCPECKEPTLRKLFNNVGVMFKGSGFYRTDSRAGSGNSDSSSSSTPAPAPSSTPSSTPSTSSSSTSGSSSSSSTPASS
ncbi:MAG: FmdB family transcriptional regulator [Actinobacteria bacterium]|nr:FmdB family transcriptional regulator [Actinomycetota bacterium]MSY38986.1 FmdB family transcriptional regulator [Actinomycetota bacterium]MSZ41590.1 FmdB family transcriptional regulator [Actinomycetota bacterium]